MTGGANRSRQSSARFRPVAIPILAESAWNSMATLARTESRANGHDLSRQIDVLNLAHNQIGARAKAPNGRNDIGHTDRS